ncbi:hypothetical protein C8J57DRAFT_1677923 [Mycena rebaudengoi]|nr:hypothetical protein C8J57DRAFT_1677923 [Mycena rebaudengoi]
MASPQPQPQPLPPGLWEELPLNLQDLPSGERRRVVRPQCADPNVTTPDNMWIIPSTQNSAYLPSAASDLMIRQEYYNLLAAQVAQLKRDFPPAPLPTQGDQMDVDGSAEVQEVPQDMKPNHLRIPDDPPDIFEETTFPNPFQHSCHGHLYRRGSALIITGLPGIGKTVFLSVIFYLRVAAGLPTAYMQSKDFMLVYTGERLFILRMPALIELAVPSNAWILLDSNVGFLSPPQDVVECDRFIVQAASPRAGRTAWASKIRGPRQFCLMRPWTLEELFTGYHVSFTQERTDVLTLVRSSLQSQVCSGSDMQAFFNKFGGSAWHVYQDSHNLPIFEDLVDASARSFDSKVIYRVMTHTSPTVAVDDLVGHMLIAALPLDDEDRTKFRLTSPTAYLEGKLLSQLNANIQMARRELYAINVGMASPGCRATAGDLLDKHHHGFIALGGKWRLRKFTKVDGASSTSKTNLWRASKEESDWVLEANGKMSIFREPVTARPRRRKQATTEFTGLTTVNFPSANVTRLKKDYYYRPTETNFPTFDSFYMDKKGHGLTFQASETDKNPHSVKNGGREWLEKRGIAKFTYILVSGPKMGEPPSISVPRDHETKFDLFFHLVLEYPELKKLLST